jgi:pimeloyl-ACP methyl ester carboxylesterase
VKGNVSNGSYFETEPGVELYYEVSGKGPPIVFVPGWTFSTEFFKHQINHFSKTHCVVSFDPRSQGRSSLTPQGNDYETQSADLCKLIDHLSLKEPVLVGWSAGSLTLWGAVRHRGTIPFKGFVFIDLPPAPMTGKDDDWTEFSVEDASKFYQGLATPEGHRDIVTWYAKEIMMVRDPSPEELDWVVDQSTKSPPWVAQAYCAAAWFSNYLPEAQEVDRALPTLFVLAESSADTAKRYLKKHIPNADHAVFGGHVMFWEHPEKFNAALQDYLEKLA